MECRRTDWADGGSISQRQSGIARCTGAAIDLVADELGDLKTLKGTVQFPLDRPIPEDLVRRLVVGKLCP